VVNVVKITLRHATLEGVTQLKDISDIGLFRSEIENIPGNPMPSYISPDKRFLAVIRRIVMKLRENHFTLGEFDHLYVNFTTCEITGEFAPSIQVDSYHPWHRFYNVQVNKEFYDDIESPNSEMAIISLVEKLLIRFFVSEEFDELRIHDCFAIALALGEDMLMKFKEKVTTRNRAVVYLRFLDTCRHSPLLQVFDSTDAMILERTLPDTIDLNYLGDIQLSSTKITIKPRRNAFSGELIPISFEFDSPRPL
jgi:hypothetical protein